MSTITFNSIGSTYLKHDAPTQNYASSSSNIIENRSDKIVYVFNAPNLSKKYIKSINFKYDVTYCNRTGGPVENTPSNSGVVAYRCSRDITSEITYSNYRNLYDYFEAIAGKSRVYVGENECYDSAFDNKMFSSGYVYIVIDGYGGEYTSGDSYEDCITTTKQATLIVNYEEPTNSASIYNPRENATLNIVNNYDVSASVYSNAIDINKTSEALTLVQNGQTTSISNTVIPANTMQEGPATITYTATMESGNNPSASVTVNALYPKPYATPTYPISIALKGSNAIVFTWDYESINFNSNQKSVVLNITQGGTTITRSATTSNNHYELAANTLAAGDASYTLTITNDANQSYTTSPVSFTVIAQSAAPTITGVSQTSIPTVTWTTTNQDAYQIKLFDGNKCLYDSGILIGPAIRSKTLPIMLPNGAYNVQIRALNTYGYYTDWESISYTLNATEPSSPTNVRAEVNENYGVEIYATAPANPGTLYVVRRDINGKEKILGRYIAGFTDYTAIPNVPYEYTVRNYNVGCGDGGWIPIIVIVDGVVLCYGSDLSRYIQMNSSNEQFEISRVDESARNLIQCLGRKYPVREGNEWITTVRTFKAYVPNLDIEKIQGIVDENKMYYKAENEFFACDVEVSRSSDYVGGGKLYSFTCTRIDDDEVNVL